MKILLACEESQAVCIEMRKRGHEAFSCDILPCSGGHPEWHIQDDVLKHLNDGWDMIIGFPPCTYLSNAGACRLFPKKKLDEARYKNGLLAKQFFMDILMADCGKIAVENPVPLNIFNLPEKSQIIQPYYFGDPFIKRTCLWLRGLSLLFHLPEDDLFDKGTHIKPEYYFIDSGSNYRSKRLSIEKVNRNQKKRSKTFPGIARAMAEQWTEDLTKRENK